MSRDLDKIEKVNFTRLEQEVMELIRKHCDENKELEKDLFALIDSIGEERDKNDTIKELAFALANKI